MSNALKALKRLEPSDPRGSANRAREAVRAGEDEVRARDATQIVPAAPTARRGAREIAELFERLRTIAGPAAPSRVLVLAPVAADVAVRPVIDGIAQRGRELAVRVGIGELVRVGGRPVLSERDKPLRRPVDLDGGTLKSAVASWLEELGGAPIVLIEAPPVRDSADAVLLAGACDGLVLVAQAGATTRVALRAAAARADSAGCRVLGVVLTTT